MTLPVVDLSLVRGGHASSIKRNVASALGLGAALLAYMGFVGFMAAGMPMPSSSASSGPTHS